MKPRLSPGLHQQLILTPQLRQAAGFSLVEIAGMFTPDGRPRIDRKTLATKAEELDHTIQQLSSMRDGLRHAAVCPAPSHMECPSLAAPRSSSRRSCPPPANRHRNRRPSVDSRARLQSPQKALVTLEMRPISPPPSA